MRAGGVTFAWAQAYVLDQVAAGREFESSVGTILPGRVTNMQDVQSSPDASRRVIDLQGAATWVVAVAAAVAAAIAGVLLIAPLARMLPPIVADYLARYESRVAGNPRARATAPGLP